MSFTITTQMLSQSLINKLQLPVEFQQIVETIYLPLTDRILEKKSDKPLFVSINGAQGDRKIYAYPFFEALD